MLFTGLVILSALSASVSGEANSKIVGGVVADAKRFPFYVALVPPSRTTAPLDVLCGSSLITQNHLLTAAHCFNGIPPTQRPQTFSGAFVLESRCEGRFARIVRVTKVALHPGYNIRTMKNDLAVMTLAETVNYNPVLLPPSKPRMRGPVTAIGYGNTKRKAGNYPCELQQVTLQLFTRQQCLRTGNFVDIVNLPNVLCAGRLSGGIDTCDGDSGGPLVRQNADGTTFIQGITSFGSGCARSGYPGVYTDVSKYLRWIRQQTGQSPSTGDEPKLSSTTVYTYIVRI